jgi:hypothetical protein
MKLTYRKEFVLITVGVFLLTVIAFLQSAQLWIKFFSLILIVNLPFTYWLDHVSTRRWHFKGRPQSYAFWTEVPSLYFALWLAYLLDGYLISSLITSTTYLMCTIAALFIRKPKCDETCSMFSKCRKAKKKK